MFREPESCAGPVADAALSHAMDKMIDGVEATMAVEATAPEPAFLEMDGPAETILARCGHPQDNPHDAIECDACFKVSLAKAREAVVAVDAYRSRMSPPSVRVDLDCDGVILPLDVEYRFEPVYDRAGEPTRRREAVATVIRMFPENETTKFICRQIDINRDEILEAMAGLGDGRN